MAKKLVVNAKDYINSHILGHCDDLSKLKEWLENCDQVIHLSPFICKIISDDLKNSACRSDQNILVVV